MYSSERQESLGISVGADNRIPGDGCLQLVSPVLADGHSGGNSNGDGTSERKNIQPQVYGRHATVCEGHTNFPHAVFLHLVMLLVRRRVDGEQDLSKSATDDTLSIFLTNTISID